MILQQILLFGISPCADETFIPAIAQLVNLQPRSLCFWLYDFDWHLLFIPTQPDTQLVGTQPNFNKLLVPIISIIEIWNWIERLWRFHLSLPCVCMKEVEAVSGEQGVWDQNDDDGLTFG